jgi:hypothetical protein
MRSSATGQLVSLGARVYRVCMCCVQVYPCTVKYKITAAGVHVTLSTQMQTLVVRRACEHDGILWLTCMRMFLSQTNLDEQSDGMAKRSAIPRWLAVGCSPSTNIVVAIALSLATVAICGASYYGLGHTCADLCDLSGRVFADGGCPWCGTGNEGLVVISYWAVMDPERFFFGVGITASAFFFLRGYTFLHLGCAGVLRRMQKELPFPQSDYNIPLLPCCSAACCRAPIGALLPRLQRLTEGAILFYVATAWITMGVQVRGRQAGRVSQSARTVVQMSVGGCERVSGVVLGR